jgi:hypothetical protein
VRVLCDTASMSGAGFHIPYVAFFGRTYTECLDMFAMQPADLREGPTLDCPSGPDSFVAEACAAGFEVVGCDPMYAHEPAQMRLLGRQNVDACIASIEAQPNSLTFRDYAAFKQAKYEAIERFTADYERNRHRYVNASLPTLPFAGRAFHRVVAANFLFTYAHREFGGLYDGREFDLAFHLKSVAEIARVARHEIRLAPMGSFAPPPRPHPYRDPVTALLRELGFSTELVPSGLDSGLAGFNDVLVARRLA